MSCRVKIGCCGFGGSQIQYFKKFKTVEAQITFYEPPQIETLKKWRDKAPNDFDFTLKAWQLITHSYTSPTYKRLRTKFPETELKNAGSFKNSSIVWKAFDKTVECSLALMAKAIVFQCPASFKPTKENIDNICDFFARAVKMIPSELKDVRLVWEPRGDWQDNLIKEICDKFSLIHCVDIFARNPVTKGEFYFRLHGGANYNHVYEDVELDWMLKQFENFHSGYCMFNNLNMINDAERLIRRIGENVNNNFINPLDNK